MTDTIKLGVNGAAGRMGQRIISLAHADPAFTVAAALEGAQSPALGRDAGEVAGIGPIGVAIRQELVPVDVVIDFSTPDGLVAIAGECARRQIALVAATTGLNADQKESVIAASKKVPLVMSPSMSLAVNLTMKLAREAAEVLRSYGPGADVEIIERHHRHKEDAPSGTALEFGRIVAAEMGQTAHVHGREGRPGKRPRNEIGYHALRVGDNVGEHTIVFGLIGETIELHVKSQSRDSYAHGALTAAKFLVGKAPGLYTISDVLGLN